eukprot:12233783-Alexandrium_andersonii.AAC.1
MPVPVEFGRAIPEEVAPSSGRGSQGRVATKQDLDIGLQLLRDRDGQEGQVGVVGQTSVHPALPLQKVLDGLVVVPLGLPPLLPELEDRCDEVSDLDALALEPGEFELVPIGRHERLDRQGRELAASLVLLVEAAHPLPHLGHVGGRIPWEQA